jgi:hypothetical protein
MLNKILFLTLFLATTFATPVSKPATAQTPAKTNLSVEGMFGDEGRTSRSTVEPLAVGRQAEALRRAEAGGTTHVRDSRSGYRYAEHCARYDSRSCESQQVIAARRSPAGNHLAADLRSIRNAVDLASGVQAIDYIVALNSPALYRTMRPSYTGPGVTITSM